MRRSLEYLLLGLAVCACLLNSCRRARIISASDLSDIYAEMFLADQWINDNPTVKRTADTTRFYETIFGKFGYTFEDYDATVNYYLKRPEKYKKILDRTVNKLRETQKALDAFSSEVERNKAILAGISKWSRPVFNADSVSIDTSFLWNLRRDTLALRDSLRLDSLRLDSLRLDSLRLDSLRRDSLRRDSLRRDSLRHSIPERKVRPKRREHSEVISRKQLQTEEF